MTLFKEAHLNARCHGANKCSSCKYLGPCDSLTMFIRTDMIFVPIKTGTLLLYVFGKIRKFNKPSTHTWSLSKPLALREHWEYNPSRVMIDHLHTLHVKYLTKVVVVYYKDVLKKIWQIVEIKDLVSTSVVVWLLSIVTKTSFVEPTKVHFLGCKMILNELFLLYSINLNVQFAYNLHTFLLLDHSVCI